MIKILLIFTILFVFASFFLPIYFEKNYVPKIELKEKWEEVGLLLPTVGFKDEIIVDICLSSKNYAILGSFVIAKKEGYRAINNYYIKYKKPNQYEFFVGKLKEGREGGKPKPRHLITYEDFKEVKKIGKYDWGTFYFIVKVDNIDFEGFEKKLETTEIIFYNEEGKYLKVNLTPIIYKPSPSLLEPLDRHFTTYLNENNYYTIKIYGACGPFLYPWKGKVEVSVYPPEDVIMKVKNSEDIVVLNDTKFIANIKDGHGVVVNFIVKFKKFGNFTIPIKLKWDKYEKTYEANFVVEEMGVI